MMHHDTHTDRGEWCPAPDTGKHPAPDLSLVVPCFNEAETIVSTVERLDRYLNACLPALSREIVLVDDGSTDHTREALAEVEKRIPGVRVERLPRNRGRGAALQRGIRLTRGAFVITLDADLSYDVDHIGEILHAFHSHPKAEAIIVSPYMKGGVVRNVPWNRLLLSRAANWLLSGFFPQRLSTVTCVVRGYRGPIIRSLPLLEEGKEFHLEVLRKLSLGQARVHEIPGRLVWKDERKRQRRGLGLKTVDAATRHVWYGLLLKPTRIFRWAAAGLILLGTWELGTIARHAASAYVPLPQGVARSLWQALSAAFSASPHTFWIAGISFVLGVQLVSFLALLQIMKLQHEETLRHLIAVLQKGSPSTGETIDRCAAS